MPSPVPRDLAVIHPSDAEKTPMPYTRHVPHDTRYVRYQVGNAHAIPGRCHTIPGRRRACHTRHVPCQLRAMQWHTPPVAISAYRTLTLASSHSRRSLVHTCVTHLFTLASSDSLVHTRVVRLTCSARGGADGPSWCVTWSAACGIPTSRGRRRGLARPASSKQAHAHAPPSRT